MTDTDTSGNAAAEMQAALAERKASKDSEVNANNATTPKAKKASNNSGADKYRIKTGDPEKRNGPLAASQEPPAPFRCKDSAFPSSYYDEAVDRFFLSAKPRQEAEVLRVGPKSTQVLRV